MWRRGDCIYYLERLASPVEAAAPSARDPDLPPAEFLPQYVGGVKLHFDL